MKRSKSKVKKEVIQPENIELLIPGAEFERTCTEDLMLAFKDISRESKARKSDKRNL
jgi:hypothetical protein